MASGAWWTALTPDMSGTLLVLPTYNEAENIRPMVERLMGLETVLDLLVVDDNSPDGTGELADNLASERPAMARDLNSQIKMLVQQGFLMREDGAVGLKLHSGKDAVVLNGHEIPPRQLQSLLHSLAR